MKYKLLVLNDMHIAPNGELYHGKDSGDIFRRSLHILIHQQRPDLLVLNGDLCAKEPDSRVYHEIASICRHFDLPFLALPGNHDDPEIMKNTLPLPETVFRNAGAKDLLINPADPYCGWAKLHNWGFLWINSFDHSVSREQLNWLEANKDSFTTAYGNLVFIHHPPIRVPSVFMENRYPLKDRDKVWKVLRELPKLRRLFCGHYHRRWDDPDEPVSMVSSSLYSIHPEAKEHMVDHCNPGFCRIKLGKKLEYTIAELPENMLQL